MKQTSIAGPPNLKYERKNIHDLNESDADGASQCSELFFRGKRENVNIQSLTKKMPERGDKYGNALLKNGRSNSSTMDANTIGGNTCIVNTYQAGKDFSEASSGSFKKCLNESLHSSSSVHCEKITSFNKPSVSMTTEDFKKPRTSLMTREGFNKPSMSLMTREERLRKQKEKQEKFQQSLHHKQLCNSPSTSQGGEPEQ
ncbi:unnamed protein product, partial [Lymnaea stagnalis]